MARSFGGVRRRPAGWWQAFCTGADGRRAYCPTHFPAAQDARGWLDELVRQRERGSWFDPAAAHQRFDRFATSWLASARVASTTKELYAGYLDNHLLPALGLMELGEISPATVRAWYAAMESKNSPTARARSYALLRQILNVAVDDGAITANPCRIKSGGTTRHKPKPTPDLVQARRIAARMPHRWRFLVVLAVTSTARYGELVALRRRDIYVLRMTVSIERQWYRGTFRETKRPASERLVFLPKMIQGLLQAHLAAYVGPSADALVFTTRNGTPRRPTGSTPSSTGRPTTSVSKASPSTAFVTSEAPSRRRPGRRRRRSCGGWASRRRGPPWSTSARCTSGTR